MQFQTEDVSYNIGRFFDLYQNKLPVVVMVTQGFFGNIIEDTFDREQVMIINGISRQKRVVAKWVMQGIPKLLSIPEDYTEKMCRIKSGIVRAESSLYNILQSNSLPLWVQFPADRVLTVGNKSINTNDIPPWKITKRFYEVYLLANTIIDGYLCTDVTHVPLYLSELSLSVVTGLKGQSVDRWKVFFDQMVYKCSAIEYDEHFGNPNIAEYDQSSIHSLTEMTYCEPKLYSDIVGLVEGPPFKVTPHPYVPLRSNGKPETNTKLAIQARPLPPLPEDIPKNKQHKSNQSDALELSAKMSNMYITPDYSDKNKSFNAKHPSCQKTETNPQYNNDIPRASIQPKIPNRVRHSKESSQIATPDRAVRPFEYRHTKDAVMNVESLSMNEVTEYLKVLNLGQYAETFKNNMIDGMMLIGLSEKMLRKDFGMNRVEVFRLLKFAKEGYIPT